MFITHNSIAYPNTHNICGNIHFKLFKNTPEAISTLCENGKRFNIFVNVPILLIGINTPPNIPVKEIKIEIIFFILIRFNASYDAR